MDLKEYERVKFALAEILRSVALRSRKNGQDGSPVFRDLFARLAEDRFNLVVVGRFNRGKTSLMNALLDTTRLPVGILPLTSVITTVSYGSDESATIEYERRSIPQRVPLDDLPDFVTERGNPGNARNVKTARVQLPAQLLRRGFHFIDTPGIGSAIAENTRTTHAFLPEADAVVLVTSFDSPLSDDEMRIVDVVRRYGRRLFFVVNKSDLIGDDERREVLDHVRARLREAGVADPEVFSVSARNAAGDELAIFERSLTRFLVEEKQRAFLRAMCERVQDVVEAFPSDETERLNLQALSRTVGARDVAERLGRSAMDETRFVACKICDQTTDAVLSFVGSFQFELLCSSQRRADLADAGGFCEVHAWLYDTLAGPRGACIALSVVLDRFAERLRAIGSKMSESDGIAAILPSKERCPVCSIRFIAESRAVKSALREIYESVDANTGYCLLHFGQIYEVLSGTTDASRIVLAEADALERVAEDMHRYVVKFDGTRRYLMDDDERAADQRGVAMLAGSRGLNGVSREQ